MKIICSLNGIDGVGKTTQSNLLKEKYGDIISIFYGLEDYEGFPKEKGEKLHEWWFNNSSIEEFCDAMYESLKNRNNEILKSNKNVIIIDKGILNFEARIRATLKVRGFSKKEINENMEKSKKKFFFTDIENLKIFIDRDKINEGKVKNSLYNQQQINLYEMYQKEQINEIIKQKQKFDIIIDYNLGIEKINETIRKSIILKIIEQKDSNGKSRDENDNFRKIYNVLDNLEEKHNMQIYNCHYITDNHRKTEKYKETLLYKAQNNCKISRKIPTKELNEYKIPLFYKNILIEFVKELRSKIDDIELLLIHGSAGRECMHENWSDLDIIICLTNYKFVEIEKTSEIINKFRGNVKIGTTIYSKLEIESLNVDAKTLFALYQMQNEQILPLIFNNVKIPVIKHEDLIQKNLMVLPEAIHKLKRLLYSGNTIDKESIIKTLNLIMKVVLINNNIFFKSYEEIFYNFAKLYNIDEFNIAKHLKKQKEKNCDLVNYAKKVLEILINY